MRYALLLCLAACSPTLQAPPDPPPRCYLSGHPMQIAMLELHDDGTVRSVPNCIGRGR